MKAGDLVQTTINSQNLKKSEIVMFLGEFDNPYGEWCYVHTSDGRKIRVPWAHLMVVSES
jgi:hypothetical protein